MVELDVMMAVVAVESRQEILRLLFNLSFDRSMAREMATPVFMSSLVDKLKKTQFRQVSLKLLYHISQDRECRAPLIETEAVQLTLRLIHGFPQVGSVSGCLVVWFYASLRLLFGTEHAVTRVDWFCHQHVSI